MKKKYFEVLVFNHIFALRNVDEEVEVGKEVSTDDGSGDVGHDESPLVFTASKGELQGFISVSQDM